MIKVLTYRKRDGRSEFICVDSDGVNTDIKIQDAISRLVDYKSLECTLKLERMRDYESEEYLVRVTF